MTPPARITAAIEVLADVETRRRPAADALKDWGLAHRFAGSGDRATIAGLVFDVLRRKASAAWIMDDASPRGLVIGTLRLARGEAPAAIAALFTGERHASPPLTTAERARLDGAVPEDAPLHVQADCPDWILPQLGLAFGDDLVPELAALTHRAPLDLRANALRAPRDEAAAALAHLAPAPTPWSPWGLRIAARDGRAPPVGAEPAYLDGGVEIQDEGSQMAALLSGARPGEDVLDLCAGGGGKTLALAAMMGGQGRLVATDTDIRRLAPIHERLRRSGATNVAVLTPRGRGDDPTAGLAGSFGCVLVDAPCTGSGTWRRHPDTKWRLRPGTLAVRRTEQAAVLDRAGALVRRGGRIVYVTCSILPDENDGAVTSFLARRPAFHPMAARDVLRGGPPRFGEAVRPTVHGLQMTPLRTGTDGFYVAVLQAESVS